MLAFKRGFITSPQSLRQSQIVFQLLEALGCGRIGNAVTFGFIFIPGRANTEISTATGENIERVDHLHQNGGMTINNARYQYTEIRFFG